MNETAGLGLPCIRGEAQPGLITNYVERQIERLREYAIREGYEVLEELADTGRSDAYPERPD